MTHRLLESLLIFAAFIGPLIALALVLLRTTNFTWKLVRDKVPDQIQARGPKMFLRQLEGQKYREALATKLIEEAREVGEAKDRYSLIDELADMCEVLEAYRVANNIPIQDVNTARLRKFATAGGFAKGYFLYAVVGLKARR